MKVPKFLGHCPCDSGIRTSLFRSFTQVSAMLHEWPKLLTKWQISGKEFYGLVNAKMHR